METDAPEELETDAPEEWDADDMRMLEVRLLNVHVSI